jgi:tryptophan synthase alpha chain
MSRITDVFQALRAQRKAALIPFITAGDPHPADTPALLHALVAGGADMIELGVPFSDPMADGPTIQRASERALAQGVCLRAVIDMVNAFRQTNTRTPIVLMGYTNPIEAFGYEAFIRAAQAAQVDGVLTVDTPPEEASPWAEQLKTAGIDPIFLLAPTSTPQRMDDVARLGSGYIYYVALKGVTGAAHLDLHTLAQRIPTVREHTGLPIGIGFGIRDAQTAAHIAHMADAVVIGSRIIEEIETAPPQERITRVCALVRSIREAMDSAPRPSA